jgi:hypothetical protein
MVINYFEEIKQGIFIVCIFLFNLGMFQNKRLRANENIAY